MFGKQLVTDMVTRSAETPADRRVFLRSAGLMGLGALGAGALGTATAGAASATDGGSKKDKDPKGGAQGPSDATVLNFALNLEYLEAEFYLRATTGEGLDRKLTEGKGERGGVDGGREVHFESRAVRQYAREIAGDELAHVAFLRRELGGAAVSRPKIDLKDSFTAAARASGLIGEDDEFDPFADENSFLLAAFIFEDVGVTAYKGAAPLISNKTYLEAAAGILAVEAYHAATIRTLLLQRDLGGATNQISDARDSLDGESDLDQGALDADGRANITPTDADAIAFSRTPGQVLNVVYLNPDAVDRGGFFPKGVNGDVRVSG